MKNEKVKKLSNITGLTHFQTALLRLMLRTSVGKKNREDFKIEFVSNVEFGRMSSFWYGGEVVNISCNGYVYHISAAGDVCATLYHNRTGRQVAYVNDENNDGLFGDEMKRYLFTDSLLYMAEANRHPVYNLCVENNNWWECSVTDPDGKRHDLEWIPGDDNLFFAVVEVAAKISDPEFAEEMNLYARGTE